VKSADIIPNFRLAVGKSNVKKNNTGISASALMPVLVSIK
jgi:hypothetical protein